MVVFLFQEVFFSIYMVLILAMIKYLTSPSTEAAIPHYPTRAVSTKVGSGQLYVSPKTSAVRNLMDNVMTRLDSDGPIKYVLFGSRNESVNAYRKNAPHVIAGINFADGSLRTLVYTIRMNQTMVASTTSPWPGTSDILSVYLWNLSYTYYIRIIFMIKVHY